MISGVLRAITACCGVGLLACLAGCSEGTLSSKLATLRGGDTIHVGYSWKGFQLHRRDIVYHYEREDRPERAVTVSKEVSFYSDATPQGYDVFQDRHRVTVWEVCGKRSRPLAVIDVARARRGESPFLVPGRGGRPTGRRIACDMTRELVQAAVPGGGVVSLSMNSRRDVGSEDDGANRDSLSLGYWHRTLFSQKVEGQSTGIDTPQNHVCAVDPFASCPEVDVRWDRTRKGVWAVDRQTRRVLGGFCAGSAFFEGRNAPQWATATSGTLVASTAGRGAGKEEKKGAR